uniref:Protein Dr1 n=1 Tax=Setaria digitata TaxID=48799 RepID=A0A915PHH3_9BILA
MGDEDNEVGLPQKGLNMIIKDVIPDMRVANESRELLNACCVEFVRHVSREAQRISADDQRKTIYHEHVQKALMNLTFPYDYVEAADSVLSECKIAAENKLKRKNSRLDKCEQLEAEAAELNRLQQENRGMQRSLSELLSKDEDDEDYDTA